MKSDKKIVINVSLTRDAKMALDIKRLHSGFKTRSGLIEFLIEVLEYLPSDISPDTDIAKMLCTIKQGDSNINSDVNNGIDSDITETKKQINKLETMKKNIQF